MKVWLSDKEIAQILGVSRQGINLKAKREGWSYRTIDGNGGKQKRYHLADLPEDIQVAYAASLNLTLEAFQGELKPAPKADIKVSIDGYKCRSSAGKTFKALEQCTEAELDIARNRQKVIAAYEQAKQEGLNCEEFVSFYNMDKVLPDVKAGLGRWGELKNWRRFYVWLKAYTQAGLAGLVPQYKKRGGAGSSLAPEVKNLLEYLYLDTNRISVADAVRHIKKVYGHEDVSEITARRYLMSIPQAVREVWRRGSAYLEKVQPSVHRDYTLYKPMEMIVGDYMTQDFMLRLRGNVYRAKVVAFMDMRTRAIVGWSLQLTANSKGVAIALQKCFDRFGLPEYIYFDNGREFKNQFLCGDVWKTRTSKIDAEDLGRNIGVVVEAGVKVIFAIPYNGKAKPIERFWRTLHEQFDKWMPTYLGSNTALSTDESKVYRQNVKKMKKEDFEKIPEFLAVEKELGNFFEHYNNCHEHTGQGMDGKTPMQVWSENSVPKREVPAELKPYLFTHRYMRTVGKDGISFDGEYYYASEVIKYLGQLECRVPGAPGKPCKCWRDTMPKVRKTIGDCLLYNAPMEDIIGDLQFDHILTDPPYLYLKADFDTPFDEAYLFENAKRILSDKGFIALFGRGTSFYRWNTRLAELDFVFKEEIVWDKQRTSGVVKYVSRVHETVSLHTKRKGVLKQSRIPYQEMREYDFKRIADDVRRIANALDKPAGIEKLKAFVRDKKLEYDIERHSRSGIVYDGGRCEAFSVRRLRMIETGMLEKSIISVGRTHYNAAHPTQKPVRLAERLLALISAPGDTIYDPFMGSGSFGVACVNTGRKYIGTEVLPEYFDIACTRVAEAQSLLEAVNA